MQIKIRLKSFYGINLKSLTKKFATIVDSLQDYYFDDDSNIVEGVPFTLWTKNRVYFPLSFEGSAWVGSVSKIPNGIATAHLSY